LIDISELVFDPRVIVDEAGGHMNVLPSLSDPPIPQSLVLPSILSDLGEQMLDVTDMLDDHRALLTDSGVVFENGIDVPGRECGK